MIMNTVTQEQLDQINNDLKEIYKEMYVPNVKRYPFTSFKVNPSAHSSLHITFDEEVNLSKTSRVALESCYYTTAQDGSGNKVPILNSKDAYASGINNVTKDGCDILFSNGSNTTSVYYFGNIVVEEWKKPTE